MAAQHSGSGQESAGDPAHKRPAFSIVSERSAFGHGLRSSLPAQFWAVPIVTSATPDGLLGTSPSDPAPLPLLVHTGTVRPQMILAAQAVKVPGFPSLPGLPAYCRDQGGLVLDRVLMHTGGESWWGVLTGRLKLQRVLRNREDLAESLRDLSNYGLCANAKVALSRATVVRARADWQGMPKRPSKQRPGAHNPSDSTEAAPAQPPAAASSATCHVRTKLAHNVEATAEVSLNQRSLSVAGPHQHAPVTTPLLLSVEAGTPVNVRDMLAWRCGLLQVTAPLNSSAGSSPAGDGTGVRGGAAGSSRMRTTAYVQGSAALQGAVSIWQAPTVPHRQRAREQPHNTGTQVNGAGSGSGSGQPPAQPAPAGNAVGAPAAAKASGTQPDSKPAAAAAPEHLSSYSASATGSASGSDSGSSCVTSESIASDDSEDLPRGPGSAWAAGGARPHRHAHHHHHPSPGAASSSAGSDGRTTSLGITLPDPAKVQEDVVSFTQRVSRLRDAVTQGTVWVADGGITNLTHKGSASATRGSAGGRQRQSAWSAFVPQPHLKVAGMIGVTARAPLIRVAHGSADGGGGPCSALGHLLSSRLEWIQDFGARALHRGRGGGSGGGGGGAPAEAAAAEAGVRGRASQRQEALRPFASGAASLQLGRFTRPVLDYTRISAKLDMGLWGPALAGPSAGKPARSHPAFALDDRGAWHALTLSACQQLLGPVRLCVDLRYELASSHLLALPPLPQDGTAAQKSSQQAAADAGRLAGWGSKAARELGQHVSGMRPCLLDAVYALDIAVPGSSGAARLVAWYAPQRKEGMVEVRLF